MVEDQQLILAAWLLVAAVLVGLGLLERRLFGPALGRAGELWQAFWMGWALLLSGLQLSHLLVPVDNRTRIGFAVLALVGWVVSAPSLWRVLRPALVRSIPALAAVLACTWWMSNRSLAGPRFGDTGLYLVPMVLWDESYAIVPGLANLYVPFGRNLSYFLYAAFVDAGPMAGHLYHVVNSVLVLAILARGLFACARLVSREPVRIAADLYHALALIPALDLAFSLYLTSPMPDTAVYLFGLVLCGELLEMLSEPVASRGTMLRVVFLAAAGVTLKLTIAGLSLVTAALALLWWMRRGASSVGAALGGAVLASLVALIPIGGWIVRNGVTSGYPFYPATILPLPVDWIARVDPLAWIQAPMAMAPLWTLFTDPAWWHTRLDSLGWMGADVTRPMILIAVGAALFVVLRPLQWWRRRAAAVPAVVLAAPLVGFYYCFANTPMPRYQGATLWILGVELLVLALATVLADGGRVLRGLTVALVLGAAALPLQRGEEAWLPLRGFEPSSPPTVHPETLKSGLVVNVPVNQVCWYAPLPCSPEIHPGLRLREPGNLAAGFAIDVDAEQ